MVSVGLQKLINLDQVKIGQKNTMFANRYTVTSATEDLVFNAKEDSSALEVMFGGSKRGFFIDLYDSDNRKVVGLRRPYSFVGQNKLEVQVGGVVVAVVRQQPTFLKTVLHINDARDLPVLRIKGPASTSMECTYDLQTLDKKSIGSITRCWRGLAQAMFSNADQFFINFPRDLDVNFKVAVIGSCLLLDFLHYEHSL